MIGNEILSYLIIFNYSNEFEFNDIILKYQLYSHFPARKDAEFQGFCKGSDRQKNK